LYDFILVPQLVESVDCPGSSFAKMLIMGNVLTPI
jgi:hypothetical protein